MPSLSTKTKKIPDVDVEIEIRPTTDPVGDNTTEESATKKSRNKKVGGFPQQKYPTKIILKQDVIFAQQHASSHKDAATILRVGYGIYKKWAQFYKLWERRSSKLLPPVRNRQDNTSPKRSVQLRGKHGLLPILEGKVPNYPWKILKSRLLAAGYVKNECMNCKYNLTRMDGMVPLLLHPYDGDYNNYSIENMYVLCYNCTYIMAKGRANPTETVSIDPTAIHNISRIIKSNLPTEDGDPNSPTPDESDQDITDIFTEDELEELRNEMDIN